MRLSANPDLRAPRSLVLVCAVVTAVIWGVLAWQKGPIGASLGDTDDAMRMVLVRSLLSGQGWYDQFLPRLQPPVGVWLHWSRLLDGALAALIWVLRSVTSPARAELAVRFAWPMLWIFPAVLCGLSLARRLGDRAAVMVTAILMLFATRLFVQFLPGRVDHHNLQIVLILASVTASLYASRRPAYAALSGAASGLGLAIGLEALMFHALVGASFALRLAQDRDEARASRAYGLGLALATAAFFAVQTPPWRWSLSFCDEIGLNLVAAVAAAGLGLALAAVLSGHVSARMRLSMIGLAGMVAVAIYLGLGPQCVHGPFVALDPRIRPFWFDRIQEIQSWRSTIVGDRPGAIRQMVMAALGMAAGIALLSRRGRKTDAGIVLVFFCVVAAAFATASARRMEAYLFWFGIPILGAALSVAARIWLRDLLAPTLIVSMALAPDVAGAIAVSVSNLAFGRPRVVHAAPIDKCFLTGAYAHLAQLPAGLVLSETDLGPFILAATADEVLAAPYHRMSFGILAAHDVLAVPTERAEALARATHADYVVDCPPYPMMVAAGSFGAALRAGTTPPWLQRLSKRNETLQIYRLTTAAHAR